jgi:hypothetical protein
LADDAGHHSINADIVPTKTNSHRHILARMIDARTQRFVKFAVSGLRFTGHNANLNRRRIEAYSEGQAGMEMLLTII